MHQQAQQGVTTLLALDHNYPEWEVTFPLQEVGNGRQVVLRVIDKEFFKYCSPGTSRKRESIQRQSLFDGPFDISGWRMEKLYMSNLLHHVTVAPGVDPEVTVLDVVQGKFTPTKAWVSPTA